MKLESFSAFMLILLSAASEVWCGVSVCTYMESSDGHTIIQTIQCRHGCCGEDDEQECCEPEVNYLMIGVFGLVGLLLVVVILVIVVALIKKKNVSRARVHESSNNHQTDNSVNHRVEGRRQPAANYIARSDVAAQHPRPTWPPANTNMPGLYVSDQNSIAMSDIGAQHPRPTWPPANTNMPGLYVVSDPPPYTISATENEKSDQWGKSLDL